jgi:hypothetical protein
MPFCTVVEWDHYFDVSVLHKLTSEPGCPTRSPTDV